jgi:hypothetical protein
LIKESRLACGYPRVREVFDTPDAAKLESRLVAEVLAARKRGSQGAGR